MRRGIKDTNRPAKRSHSVFDPFSPAGCTVSFEREGKVHRWRPTRGNWRKSGPRLSVDKPSWDCGDPFESRADEWSHFDPSRISYAPFYILQMYIRSRISTAFNQESYLLYIRPHKCLDTRNCINYRRIRESYLNIRNSWLSWSPEETAMPRSNWTGREYLDTMRIDRRNFPR